jgi:hypothetical protein
MPRAEFEPVTPPTKRPQTYALDRAATEVGTLNYFLNLNFLPWYYNKMIYTNGDLTFNHVLVSSLIYKG